MLNVMFCSCHLGILNHFFFWKKHYLMFHWALETILLGLAEESLTKDLIKARREIEEKMVGRFLLVRKGESKGSHPVT